MTIEAVESSIEQEPKHRKSLVYAKPQEERPYVSAGVVADYMGMCVQAIWAWIKKGRLEGYKVGRAYRVPLPAFEELKKKFPRPEATEE